MVFLNRLFHKIEEFGQQHVHSCSFLLFEKGVFLEEFG